MAGTRAASVCVPTGKEQLREGLHSSGKVLVLAPKISLNTI